MSTKRHVPDHFTMYNFANKKLKESIDSIKKHYAENG